MRRKGLLILTLAVIMVCSLCLFCGCNPSANGENSSRQDSTDILNFVLLSNETYEVSGITDSEATQVIIPSIYNEKAVTSIGDDAFEGCTLIEEIVIPNSVTKIGLQAFNGCISLNKVDFLGSIDDWVQITFADSTSNPTYKTKELHVNGKLLTAVIIDKATKVNSYALYNLNTLNSIYISTNVTEIGMSAFEGCSAVQEIFIPFVGQAERQDAISHFGHIFGAKKYAENANFVPSTLTEIYMIGGTLINDYAFNGLENVSIISIPDTIEKVSVKAFEGCTSLLGYEYKNCYYLGNIENPCLVLVGVKDTSIAYCEVNSNTKVVCGSPFDDCKKIEMATVPASVIEKLPKDSLRTLVINGGEVIPANAFNNCTTLKSVSLPATIKTIGKYVFYGCASLESITVDENNANFKSINGDLYSKDGKTLIQYAVGKTADSFEISSEVTSIEEYAFAYSKSLVNITIPSSVVLISANAFEETFLTSATFENTSGWFYCESAWETRGRTIPSAELFDTATAADYLSRVYQNHYLKVKQ